MSLTAVLQWIAATRASEALRESVWSYPIVESAHVLSMGLFFGMIMMLDLRLLGVTLRRTPISQIIERVLPLAFVGFGIMVGTGLLLFWADPVRFVRNVFFQAKLAMMIMAGANALIFHLTLRRTVASWERTFPTPARARLAGALSLLLWTGVVVAGRMIAYNWFN